jgi:hypothetical protein
MGKIRRMYFSVMLFDKVDVDPSCGYEGTKANVALSDWKRKIVL